MKDLYREKDVVGNISHIKFSCIDSKSIQQMSHVKVEALDMYIAGQPGVPHPLGPLSRKLGISQKDAECETCNQTLDYCPGHFGYIDLFLPVYHYGYFKHILQIMQNICKSCSRLLITPAQIEKFTKSARSTSTDYITKKIATKTLHTLCMNVKICPHCRERNGVVKKMAPFRIVHEKFRSIAKRDEIIRTNFLSQYDYVKRVTPDVGGHIQSSPWDVYMPNRVLQLFQKITPGDVEVLRMDMDVSHPVDFILQRLVVPPACIRPSVKSTVGNSKGTTEDDITAVFSAILNYNSMLEQAVSRNKVEDITHAWEWMQILAAVLVNAQLTLPKEMVNNQKTVQISSGYIQRLKGKQGRFRTNLSGKRVNFSGRTVISPDPNLKLTQVGVPVEVARILTYPEKVTEHNIHLMRQLVINGPFKHPGALFLHEKTTGIKKMLKHIMNRIHETAQNLRIGDIIDRHLMDGDTVLFNRQPSLHKMSIMAHKVVVLPWRTFRFNECVCGPYNADFDGDEMNLHLPQTEEARAEAYTLMGVTSNLVTPRSGALIIGATQDFITGTYLLTKKDKFFDYTSMCRLLMSIVQPGVRIDLPKPAIMKPVQLWTGKQIFSLVLRPNRSSALRVNLLTSKCKDKECICQKPTMHELCNSDNFVHIRNSELLSGVLDKSTIGAGSKKNIFYAILKDFGKEESAEAMWRVSRISIQFLMMYGFSIGIGDLSPSQDLLTMKESLLRQGYAQCDRFIQQLKNNELESAPGCDAEESLEQVILRELSQIRENAGRGCISELNRDNSALVMAVSGSKGSTINISQMIACVGQQAVSGKRVPEGFLNRSLPHFPHHSKSPEAKGFVSNSFFSGLTPSEFLFHTMGGREGLVDTAVKTAETGYMQRRLMKCLEDLYVAYDGTVRNSRQHVIQFKYGHDGLDPCHIETSDSCGEDSKRALLKEKVSGVNQRPMTKRPMTKRFARNKENKDSSEIPEHNKDNDDKSSILGTTNGQTENKVLNTNGLMENNDGEATHVDQDNIPASLDFERILYHVKAVTNEVALEAKEVRMRRLMKDGGRQEMEDSDDEEQEVTSETLLQDTRKFLKDLPHLDSCFKASVLRFMEQERNRMEKAEQLELHINSSSDIKMNDSCKVENSGDYKILDRRHRLRRLTLEQLIAFLTSLANRYVGCSAPAPIVPERGTLAPPHLEAGPGIVIEAGTTVGALSAQSIGEPATQMTLKTFHFAGVAAMNITQGVPRIKEIINASRNISTPIITAQLLHNTDALKARQVKARIEKTLLSDICDSITYISNGTDQRYVIKLSATHINLLQLKVSADSVKYAICRAKLKCKITESQVNVESQTQLSVVPNAFSGKDDPYHQMHYVIKYLPRVVVNGIPTISRAVIHQRSRDSHPGTEIYRRAHPGARGNLAMSKGNNYPESEVLPPMEGVVEQTIKSEPMDVCSDVTADPPPSEHVYELLVEGNNLRDVMGTYGVDGTRCISNNINEVQDTLGIDAASATIKHEITTTMSSHGLAVDSRHINLLADLMTCRGRVNGITRHGLTQLCASVLALASFESTSDHLFQAAYHGQTDIIDGVSDCVIMGKPINLGTGVFKLVQQHNHADGSKQPAAHHLNPDQLDHLKHHEQQQKLMQKLNRTKRKGKNDEDDLDMNNVFMGEMKHPTGPSKSNNVAQPMEEMRRVDLSSMLADLSTIAPPRPPLMGGGRRRPLFHRPGAHVPLYPEDDYDE